MTRRRSGAPPPSAAVGALEAADADHDQFARRTSGRFLFLTVAMGAVGFGCAVMIALGAG